MGSAPGPGGGGDPGGCQLHVAPSVADAAPGTRAGQAPRWGQVRVLLLSWVLWNFAAWFEDSCAPGWTEHPGPALTALPLSLLLCSVAVGSAPAWLLHCAGAGAGTGLGCARCICAFYHVERAHWSQGRQSQAGDTVPASTGTDTSTMHGVGSSLQQLLVPVACVLGVGCETRGADLQQSGAPSCLIPAPATCPACWDRPCVWQ